LHLRKTTDPGAGRSASSPAAARIAPPKPMPDQPPTSAGPEMGGEVRGTPAPIENPPKEES
jgi:hypothetical protein